MTGRRMRLVPLAVLESASCCHSLVDTSNDHSADERAVIDRTAAKQVEVSG